MISLIALFAMLDRVRTLRARGGTTVARPAIFLLDEPEAHLHPRLQGQVGEELAQVAADFGVQLVLATHSVEMVNRLGQRPGALLLSVDRLTSSIVELRTESEIIAALDEFCDLTPFTSLSFLASRRVLFFEGPSDLRFLQAAARAYFRSDEVRHRRWQQYTPIALEGVANASARGVLKAVLTPKLFPRLTATNPVRAAMALDRDYQREPKSPVASPIAPHMEAIEVVWSRNCIESLFLDAPCLLAWLAPQLGTDQPDLLPLIEAAIAAADKKQELLDQAIDLRVPYHRHLDDEKRMLSQDAATKLARGEVRGNPAAFQKGKRRASAILEVLRGSLRPVLRVRLRGGLLDLIERTSPDLVADPAVAVPKEIRDFLDLMVTS